MDDEMNSSLDNNLEDMSYSFFADRGSYVDSEIVNNQTSSFPQKIKNDVIGQTPPDPLHAITKRSKERWTEDSAVTNCKDCKATFRIYRRRHHCIAEGTLVTLSNGVSKKIESLRVGDFVVSYNKETGLSTNSFVSVFFNQDLEQCYKIILEDGRELLATSDHKILTKEGYVPLSNLKPSQRVICSPLVGLYNGGDEKEIIRARLLGFLKTSDLDDLSDEDRVIVDRDITISNYLNENSPPLDTASLKREYIAGYFGNRKMYVEVKTYTEQVRRIKEAEQVEKWLNELGVSCRLEVTVENYTCTFDFNMSLYTFAKKIGIRYCIQKQIDLHLLDLKDNLSNGNAQATSSYSSFLKYIEYDDEKRVYSLRVGKIEKHEVRQVYDISVPENESFVAGGIVVSNCRSCSDVFCDTCSSYRSKIPKVIKKIPTRSGKEEPIDYTVDVRLCLKCFTSYQSIHKLEKLFTIFSLLSLNLYDFKVIACVCKEWNMISAFYMSKFREIQYKLPKQSYNTWEKQALWTNRYLLQHHSIWETHVLRALDGEKFEKAVDIYYGNNTTNSSMKRIPSFQGRQCWNRMCSRYCKHELDAERALLLFDTLFKEAGVKTINLVACNIVNTFNKCDDYVLECYLWYILHKGVNNEVIKQFIFERCEKNLRIANCTYWYFKLHNKVLLAELIEKLPQEFYRQIIRAQSFAEIVSETKSVEDLKEIKGSIISVLSPELGEQQIYSDKIHVKESATRPILIPLSKSIILKKSDDVRKDYVIIDQVVRLMEKILQEHGLKIDVITYNVQPTSENEGFIQIVENCETLYNIGEKLKITLTNYLLKNNPNESVAQLRQRFVKSCAFWSVICFLLSISDRNSDNLMLTTTGNYFNIDMGYCLGCDPKPLRTSCIRITNQMLEALGGENSREYEEFKELCSTIYDILRRHVNTFVCLLSLIPTFKSNSTTSPNINEEAMMREIIRRFCPGETYDTAVNNLKTRIDNSANNSTLTKYHVIDFFHKVNKEKTISTYMYVGYEGGKQLLSSMYSYLGSFT